MAIQVCAGCDKKLKVPDGAEGKKIRCPHCKALLLIGEDGLEVYDPEAVGAITEKPASKSSRRRADDEDEDDQEEEDRPRRKRRKGAGIPTWVWIAGGSGIAVAAGLVILFVFVLGGSKFSSIKEGMAEKDVREKLGKPAMELMMGGSGFAIWTDPPFKEEDLFNLTNPPKIKEAVAVNFEKGKVTKVEIKSGSDFKPGMGGGGGGGRPRK